MYNFKIKNIRTNDGNDITPRKINVIIGPNNCGKSRFLKDLKDTLQYDNGDAPKRIIVKEMSYELPDNKDEFIERYKIRDLLYSDVNHQLFIKNFSGIRNYQFNTEYSMNNYLDTGNIAISNEWENELEENIKNFCDDLILEEDIKTKYNLPDNARIMHEEYAIYSDDDGKEIRIDLAGDGNPVLIPKGEMVNQFVNTYGALFVNYLGTEEKLLLCKKQRIYGVDDQNTNFLSEVQSDLELVNSLSYWTKKLFQKDIYLDRYNNGGNILFRIGKDFSFIRNAPRDDNTAETELRNYNTLDEEGDGLKSFVTNYLTLKMGNKNIMLLDEPESFLHPPLARQLGEIIGESESDDKQIFIATHSVELLKGILSKGSDVNIIRITRVEENRNCISILDHESLKSIMNTPRFRVSRIIEGLLCEKVVLVEAEADEVIYQELIEKCFPQSGLYFAHGENKQTLPDVAEVYKNIGCNFEIITDFDAIRQPSELSRFFKITSIGEKERNEILKQAALWRKMIETAGDSKDIVYHKLGVKYWDSNKEQKDNIKRTLAIMAEHHVHIVETGELETILIPYGLPHINDKSKWAKQALEKIETLTKEEIAEKENDNLYSFLEKNVGPQYSQKNEKEGTTSIENADGVIIELISKKLAKGKNIAQIAEAIEETEERVQQIIRNY